MTNHPRILFALALTATPLAGQTGAYTLTSGSVATTGQTYAGTAVDESAIYVTGGNLTLTDATITKLAGNTTSVDTSSQYGLNAGVLVTGGRVTLTGGSVTTAAAGANGLFATGSSAVITMTGGNITTTGTASHGIDVTYGGTINLNQVNVSTTGASASAALSTDFGGGTLNVVGGIVRTTGEKSPAVYSTGNVTVTSATLTATTGSGGVIDGSNWITLNNCTTTAYKNGVYVHHSTGSGTSSAAITIAGGALTATNGPVFSLTSQSGSAAVAITVRDDAALTSGTSQLIYAATNVTATLTAIGTDLSGNLVADASSSITLNARNGASYAGAPTARTTVVVDATSAWTATGASTLVSLTTAGNLVVSTLATPVTVTGAATLGGTLKVALEATPSAGTYSILRAGSISGTFANLAFSPALDSGQSAQLSYGTTAVTLTITGSPSTTGPTLTRQPTSITVAAGATATFSVAASGTGLSYQWRKDGVNVSGQTNALLVLTGATAADAGSYSVAVTDAGGTSASSAATLAVLTTGDPGRLVNLSARAKVGSGVNVLIAGFTTGGTGTAGTRPLLLRGIGPRLTAFDLSGVLAAPVLILYSATGTELDRNAGWGGSETITNANTAVGAFALTDPASKDAALYFAAPPAGGYTTHIVSGTGTSGLALTEVYDAGTYAATRPRLVNLSARACCGTGSDVLIGGFVIGGSTAKTVLIRAAGPALAGFGLTNTLSDPVLQLYDRAGTVLMSNAGWGGDAQIVALANRAYASAWSDGASADSALVVTLPAGNYTAMVSSASGASGLALVEIYDIE
ncbi:hypothetical protein [Opitutus sp. ER46]|uniref:beta strand repeat-containing protein n=1 Tax=Opitutus sp. ER46 TaxID=2161864 RepID=UPI0013050550|nr:hypothetical protein [Opitutus sp. ER46]